MIYHILQPLTLTELIGMHRSAVHLFTFCFNDYTSLLMITQQFVMLVLIVTRLPCPAILYWMTALMKIKFVLVNQKLNAELSQHRKLWEFWRSLLSTTTHTWFWWEIRSVLWCKGPSDLIIKLKETNRFKVY